MEIRATGLKTARAWLREVEVRAGLGVGLDDGLDEQGQGQLVVDAEQDAQAGQDEDRDDDGRLAFLDRRDLARPLAEEHGVAGLEERGEGEDGPDPGGDGEDRVARSRGRRGRPSPWRRSR